MFLDELKWLPGWQCRENRPPWVSLRDGAQSLRMRWRERVPVDRAKVCRIGKVKTMVNAQQFI